MTLPNAITLFRIALIPVFMIFAYNMDIPACAITALIIFIIASVSDFIDGYIARKYNQITNFGKIMDPLADKLLTFSALFIFLELGMTPGVVVMLILARELLISALRAVAAGEGKVLAADFSGKVKTFVQMAAIILMLSPLPGLIGERYRIYHLLSWLMAAVTVWSGLDYVIKNRRFFKISN